MMNYFLAKFSIKAKVTFFYNMKSCLNLKIKYYTSQIKNEARIRNVFGKYVEQFAEY